MPHQLPQTGFLRLKDVIGDKKTDTPALIPVSKASWYKGSREGRFPKGIKLGPRTTVYPVEAVRQLIASMTEAR